MIGTIWPQTQSKKSTSRKNKRDNLSYFTYILNMIAPHHFTTAPSHFSAPQPFAPHHLHHSYCTTNLPQHPSTFAYCYPPMHAPVRVTEPHLYSQSPPITAAHLSSAKKKFKATKRFISSNSNTSSSSNSDIGEDPTNPGESSGKKNKTIPFASSVDNKLGIVKKRSCNQRLNSNGGGGQKIEITKEVMSQYFNMSQSLAAKLLGVSVSTLKRRYYELFKGGQRWPFQSIPLKERKKSIYYLVNEEEPLDAKELDNQTMEHLCTIFDKCTPIVSTSTSESASTASPSISDRSTSESPVSSLSPTSMDQE